MPSIPTTRGGDGGGGQALGDLSPDENSCIWRPRMHFEHSPVQIFWSRGASTMAARNHFGIP